MGNSNCCSKKVSKEAVKETDQKSVATHKVAQEVQEQQQPQKDSFEIDCDLNHNEILNDGSDRHAIKPFMSHGSINNAESNKAVEGTVSDFQLVGTISRSN